MSIIRLLLSAIHYQLILIIQSNLTADGRQPNACVRSKGLVAAPQDKARRRGVFWPAAPHIEAEASDKAVKSNTSVTLV
jgi:hypothetical protein